MLTMVAVRASQVGEGAWMIRSGATTFVRSERSRSRPVASATRGSGLGPRSRALFTSSAADLRSTGRHEAGHVDRVVDVAREGDDPAGAGGADLGAGAASRAMLSASTTRFQPSAARAVARARPRPRLAPVIRAVLRIWRPV